MVSVHASRSSDPGSSPGRGHSVVFLGKTVFSYNASLYPGKWVPARLMLGVTLRWTTSHPGGSSNASSRFMFLLGSSSGISSLFI